MKKNHVILFICTSLISCCKAQNKTAGNYSYKTECLGVEGDGSQTLKAWGNGRNRQDAVEQAKKNAVRDVLFKGINEGKSECNMKPIISQVNAQDQYENYFNKFFADDGEYKNYISLKDEKYLDKVSRDKKGARESVTHGLVVRILRDELKQKMITDGILKIN
jgi:hypothetical protein